MTYAFQHSRPCILSDGGRSISSRPRQANDCAVRALAIAARVSYDEAYDALKSAGRKSGRGTEELPLIAAIGALGFDHRRHSFPSVKGQRHVNAVSFPERFPLGRFIVLTAKHYFTYIDGVAYDSAAPAADRCIYGAIEIFGPKKDAR